MGHTIELLEFSLLQLLREKQTQQIKNNLNIEHVTMERSSQFFFLHFLIEYEFYDLKAID